jgi:4-alpha-glucanotransferase
MLARASGVLLPIFSLPSRFGIGDLGPEALRFADFLQAAGQRIWQILPLNPTTARCDHSPYHGSASFAFNPLLISLELLAAEGLIARGELRSPHRPPRGRIDYAAVEAFKRPLLAKACRRFQRQLPDADYERFCADHRSWIDDYALFAAIAAQRPELTWDRWPPRFRQPAPAIPDRLRHTLREAMEHLKIEQYLFFRQWQQLRRHCRDRGIQLFGDMAIYVPFHSADVWANRRLFKLDRQHRPVAVSGVGPDYFSSEGQLWGHPVYDWDRHRRTGFAWWMQRIAHQMSLVDMLRIDHFRALVAYWEIPAAAPTARNGRWVEAPAEAFFATLQRRFVSLPVVAEDLGHITADVRETLQQLGIPGMRVLLFGFSGTPVANPHAPHNIPAHAVVYSGTHDNNTVRGWFASEASAEEKRRLALACGRQVTAREAPWELIRLAMLSPARWSILPVQDLLGLGAGGRLNTPGTPGGNWRWRLTRSQFEALPAKRLHAMTAAFGRA